MHTYHYPKLAEGKAGITSAAFSILFDAKKATVELTDAEQLLIDNFFDSLKWKDKL